MSRPNKSSAAGKRGAARPPASLRAILTALSFGVLVGVSLLTFPAGVLLMVAVWLICHTASALRGKPGWLPLLACCAVLLVKGLAWLPGLVFLLIVMGCTCALRFARRNKTPGLPAPVRNASLAIMWFAWLIALLDSTGSARTSRQPRFDPQRPVVCLGDSLTAYGYPDELARRLSVPVKNLGVDGISTSDALEMLPDILKLRPQAVVVELGGHDFLLGHGRETCRRNLETIIQACRAIDAEVVLVEIPRSIVSDPFMGLERRLARRHDLQLVSDTVLRRFVLFSPLAPPGMWLPRQRHLSDDGLHPNDRGNELLARTLRDALVRVFGPAIATTSLSISESRSRSFDDAAWELPTRWFDRQRALRAARTCARSPRVAP